ncbi:conserved hypothetical protein [Magnetospirillum sp. LM-5]|uniref:DNA polymerase III n=1 Tax=Magnetospirillum sp. LM-5 TaxID=2681466 RepID=UPI00138615D9|nr:DNA polymerase III [Magnetospirillum sp. LM-5]CAA7616500.1 conserved hypothetical protein [Magnetospirillum sp. LM-5]
MSSVAPPPAPLPVTGSAVSGPVALTVTGGQIANAALGSMMEAVAQARAAKGAMTVATPDGMVQLKALPGQTLPPIPEGARLLLQVTDQGVTLLAVNGRPLAGMTLPGAPTLAGAPFAGPQTAMPPFMGAATGQAGAPGTPGTQTGTPMAGPQAGAPAASLPGAPAGLTATMIRPASGQGMALATAAQPGTLDAGLPPDLPAGTRLTVRIAGIELPGQTPPQTIPAAPQTAMAPAAASPGRPGQPAQAPQSAPPTLPGDLAVPAAATAPRLLTATVVAHPPGGQAVVQTPAGTLALPTGSDLPVGTRLQLELAGQPEPPPPAAAAGPGQAASTGLRPGGWPTLAETMTTLNAAGDRQALDMLMRSLPQVGPRLAANIALFAGAMRSGDVRAVLPDGTTRGLEKAGRKDLAERLKAELEQMAPEGGRPVAGGEWTAFTLPLLFGQVVDPVQLYVRRRQGEDESDPAKGGGGERFLLDFNLSRLGRMQMDGLVRRDDKLFDLIIRTDQPLPPEMRHDILGIFTNAAELVGTKGSVAFQSGGRWVELPPDAPPPTKIVV